MWACVCDDENLIEFIAANSSRSGTLAWTEDKLYSSLMMVKQMNEKIRLLKHKKQMNEWWEREIVVETQFDVCVIQIPNQLWMLKKSSKIYILWWLVGWLVRGWNEKKRDPVYPSQSNVFITTTTTTITKYDVEKGSITFWKRKLRFESTLFWMIIFMYPF